MSHNDELEEQVIDKFVTCLRSAGGLVPGGGVIAEAIASTIPNLRVDRMVTYIRRLNDQVDLLQGQVRQLLDERINNPKYVVLLEDGALYAVRSSSEDKIRYISSAVINGMTSEHLATIESRHLLGILNEINEIEILWLALFAHETIYEHKEFIKKYPVLEDISVYMGDRTEKRESKAIQDSYKAHLERLQLIKRISNRTEITVLGRRILKMANFEDMVTV